VRTEKRDFRKKLPDRREWNGRRNRKGSIKYGDQLGGDGPKRGRKEKGSKPCERLKKAALMTHAGAGEELNEQKSGVNHS